MGFYPKLTLISKSHQRLASLNYLSLLKLIGQYCTIHASPEHVFTETIHPAGLQRTNVIIVQPVSKQSRPCCFNVGFRCIEPLIANHGTTQPADSLPFRKSFPVIRLRLCHRLTEQGYQRLALGYVLTQFHVTPQHH